MQPNKKRLSLDIDPEMQHRLKAASAAKGVTMRHYCLTAIDKELASDETTATPTAPVNPFSFDKLEAKRDAILGDRPFSGNSVDPIHEARDIRNAQTDSATSPSNAGFDYQALERLIERRNALFGGQPLPGNSVDLIREAREIRDAEMDNW